MEIIGNSEAWKLISEINPEKSRSFLIEGPRGVAKSALAKKLAANILGAEERIFTKSHADFLLIEKRTDEKTGKTKPEILIDDARKISEFLSLTPAEGKYRVVIVDSADELRVEAANAILKIVEEPPKSAIIILLSHGGRVLPTIRSRCVTIRARPLADSEFARVMMKLKPELGFDDSELLGKISENSPGVAAEILANDGLKLYAELLRIFGSFPKANTSEIIKFAENVDKQKEGWEVFKTIFGFVVAGIAKAGVGAEKFSASPPKNLLKFLEEVENWHNFANEAETYNLDKKQVIGLLLNKISASY